MSWQHSTSLFCCCTYVFFFFFFQAEDGIRDVAVTGVQTCALPILAATGLGGDDARPRLEVGSRRAERPRARHVRVPDEAPARRKMGKSRPAVFGRHEVFPLVGGPGGGGDERGVLPVLRQRQRAPPRPLIV